MKRLLSLVILASLVLSNNSLLSQEIRVSNVKSKEFPAYQGELIVRNPEGLDSSRLIFSEGDSILNVTIEAGQNAKIESSKKEVLFLVLNHQGHDDRTRWYQEVIQKAIEDGLIQAGDSYAIQSFDCQRPEYNDPKKQLLFPESPNFVSDSEEFSSQVNEIDLNKDKFLHNCIDRSDIYGALFEALETFNKMPLQKGTIRSIVVFADDYSLVTKIGQDNVIARSREYNIPIYGITYWQNNQNKYGVEPICDATYGSFYVDSKRDKSDAVSTLLAYTNEMHARAAGVSYLFNFTSPFQKDGLTHGVKVAFNNELAPLTYLSPEMTFFEWVSANPILSGGIVLGVLALIIILIVLRKKSKKSREEKERLHAEEMQRMEAKQSEANARVNKQEEELNRIRKEEQEKEQRASQEKLRLQKEDENKVKVQQMIARGNLPWFTFEYQGNTGSFEVNNSEFTIGRDANNNYKIDLPIVSRYHFKISFDSGIYTLTDLQSSNGTFVNGQKTNLTVLKHGDVINIGDVNLTFHI